MFLGLKKKSNSNYSYNLILFNSKKRVLKKIGTFFYNKQLNIFVLNVDFFQLFLLFKKGVYFNLYFYKIMFKYLNSFKF